VGFYVAAIAFFLGAMFAPFVFMQRFSLIMIGMLYEKSIDGLIVFSVIFQLAALPVFMWASATAGKLSATK
jgi:hypothetical protein